jgi:hypothetical protein
LARIGWKWVIAAAESAAGMMQGCVDDGVRAIDESVGCVSIAELSGRPLESAPGIGEPTAIAVRPVPAAAGVAFTQQVIHDVPPHESGRSNDGNSHANAPS